MRNAPFGRTTRDPRVALAAIAAVVLSLSATSLTAGDRSDAFNDGPWPFNSPVRPDVPVAPEAASANPIDAFIAHALAEHGLRPGPPADRLTLLRRVTLDLTGLAPTLAEQLAFLADNSRDAYEKVVDRLLESPHYGERWAQHWLDVVRYAETDGFKADELRPEAYRYRDYVIRALNDDVPYDQFVREQLAGDELAPDDPRALVAAGLNRLYPDESNAANVEQRRQEIHNDLTETTGLTFLGLTVGCAQCHDHKFDPISQVDYYRLQAFFATMLPRDDRPLAGADQMRRYKRRLAAWNEATRDIRAEMDELIAGRHKAAMTDGLRKFEPRLRDAVRKPPEERTALEQQLAYQMMRYIRPKLAGLAKQLKGEDKARYESLKKQLADFDHLKPEPLPVAMTVSDAAGDPPTTHVLGAGDHRNVRDAVQPGFPAFLGESEPSIVPPPGSTTSGRRAALAEWLCRADHPLTARVMVNRLWQHHFGTGIVATPNDFGAMGQPPTHPDLLDWLAVEFVDRGWSIKAMHRLMVTSATYRQSARVDMADKRAALANQRDPDNHLLWRANRRRLEGEAVRDVMLQLSGQLNRRMFGRSARPDLPSDLDSRYAWKPDADEANRNRRSIYVFAKRNLRYPLLDVFDMPDMHNSCPSRPRTTTAPQALAMLNGSFALEQARRWSGRLLAEHRSDLETFARAAFAEAYARPANVKELQVARQFVSSQTAIIKQAGDATANGSLPEPMPKRLPPALAAAYVDFCHAILNSNEFLYVD